MSTEVATFLSEGSAGNKPGGETMMPIEAIGKKVHDKLTCEPSPAASVGHTSTESTAWPDEDTSPLRTPVAHHDEPEDCGSPTASPSADRAQRDTLKPKLPPAIAEEQPCEGDDAAGPQDPNLPSRGSSTHESGNCSPCVWHWKPQGCQRGKECGYCHLCPEGEIKDRKKAKLATIRAKHAPSAGKEEVEDGAGSGGGSPASAEAEPPQKDGVETPGSALHGTGECRPCAWFHKPQGCLNGAQCRHCHLCPEGEIKQRKKTKTDMARTNSSKNEAYAQDEEIPPPPGLLGLKNGREPAESVGSSLHGTGECRPCAWYHKAQGCQNGAECRHCHQCPEGEIKLRRKLRAAATETAGDEDDDDDVVDDEQDSDSTDNLEKFDPSEPVKVLLPVASKRKPQSTEPLPSPGSALHATGECRPCAWFYKPRGCENGADCRHCHLCPEGEIRSRRKNKATAMKKQHSDEKELDMEQALWMVQKQQEALLTASWQAQAQWQLATASAEQAAMALAALSSPLAMDPVLTMAAAMSNAAAVAATVAIMGSVASPMAASGAAMYGEDDSEMPSTGSQMHALGKCRPCAWFWKPQGCQNGEACAHCHLCPEGELKARKRVKEAAMRMGVLTPSNGSPATETPTAGRTPKLIKIASCLAA